RELVDSFKEASFGLLLPVLILGGILGGVFTPTEAAAVGVLIAFIIGKFIYREFTWRQVPEALTSAAISTGVVMLVIGFSQGLAFVLASQQVPQQVAAAMLGLTDQGWLLVLLLIIVLLLVGTFLEPAAALIILTPRSEERRVGKECRCRWGRCQSANRLGERSDARIVR